MELNFEKLGGLIPAIIQDNITGRVLMLGFMNEEAFRKTEETGKVTFFSRTRNRLWTKGEESGHFLNVVSVKEDCDSDTLLIKVNPVGTVCHTGADTCWNEENKIDAQSILSIEDFFKTYEKKSENSLSPQELNRLAQTVGENAVATVLEAIHGEKDAFLNEASELLHALFILVGSKGISIEELLKQWNKKTT